MATIDQKTIDELKEKHGDKLSLVAGVVFRKPKRGEWDRYTDKLLADKNQMSRAARELAASCVVWPNQETMNAALEDRPALLLNQFLSCLTEMAGGDEEEEEVKKL